MQPKPLDTVILVDDSSLDNKLHRRVIERTGLATNVLAFSMADDAIDYFRSPGAMPAELILLDINMPRMDGFEMLDTAIQEFGERFSPSVVVMLTTSLDPKDQSRADSFEVIKDYCQKPLTADRFAEIVQAVSP